MRFAAILLVCLTGAAGQAAAEPCDHADAIGTARTITVDPAELPRVGTMQYRTSLPLNDHEVVITFDDGPLPHYTDRVHDFVDTATRFDYVAGTYAGAEGTTWRENVARWVGDDWACFVDVEHHRANVDGRSEPVDFAYRATHLLRREQGIWKVVLRHADPIASFRGPQFAHAQ